MPFAQPNSADALAKRLHIHLKEAASTTTLKDCGWLEFLKFDKPNTSIPIEMAKKALGYICVDDDGNWRGDRDIVAAIFSFIHAECGANPSNEQYAELIKILELHPVNIAGVAAWFERTFPPSEEE